MTYRTTLTPQDFARVATAMGFEYVESSCFATTYRRGPDLMSIEEPETEIYIDLEVATDFRFTDKEAATFCLRRL